MAFVVDQHPVGAFGSYGAHPAFGITVGPRRPWRRLHHHDAMAGEDLVEGGGELGIPITEAYSSP